MSARQKLASALAGGHESIIPLMLGVADEILNEHAHELAEEIRNMQEGIIRMSGRRVSDVDLIADLIDPRVEK